MPDVIKNYVAGRYLPSSGGDAFDNIDPATNVLIGRVESADAAIVEAAIQAAEAGFDRWRAFTGEDRARILYNAARILRARNRELAEIEVRDTGKPIQEAEAVDVISGAECLEHFAARATAIHGTHVPLPNAFVYTRREPLGVCVGIGAWNYPIQIACWKSAPALACGNAMIFKASEMTPSTAAKLAEIYTEAGLPDGVFNVLQGDARVGSLLTADPRVAKVSLTGSVPTGKKVLAAAAATLKRTTMELGGKSAMLVFADADLKQAVSGAMLANFYTQGEICTNCTRVFVHADIHDAFVDQLVARTAKLKVGDPMAADTQVGALISRAHMQKVLDYISRGRAEGATLRYGGERVTRPPLDKGNFVTPAIFTGCHDDMAIVREEIFGPVMSVLSFTDENEAVRRANATRFGLAASVFTRDLSRAHRVSAALQAGVCWVNTYGPTPMAMPFGGAKESGIGHENGDAAIEHYTQLKSIYVELGDVPCPYD